MNQLTADINNIIVSRLDTYIDSTLNKAKAVNKPYRAIKRTEDYKTFHQMFKGGIKDQGQWASDNFLKLADSAGINDDLQPLTLEQTQKLRGLLSRDMPGLADYVSEVKVFDGLRNFFEWSVVQQYRRWGYIAKAGIQFKLTNPKYIGTLQDRASYLLNKSSLDQTTLDNVIDIVSEGKLDGMTNAEVASFLADQMDDISDSRAEMIARTESANAIGNANHASATENGATTHLWVAAGDNPDEECLSNEDDGEIPISQEFSSGNLSEPAHPNCECYTEAGEIDLDSINVWRGE